MLKDHSVDSLANRPAEFALMHPLCNEAILTLLSRGLNVWVTMLVLAFFPVHTGSLLSKPESDKGQNLPNWKRGGDHTYLAAEMPLDGIRSHFDYTLPDRRCEQFISSNRVLLPIMHYVHYVKRFDPNSRMVSGNP